MEVKGPAIFIFSYFSIVFTQIVTDYRLPSDIRPLSYNVQITPDLRTFIFNGQVTFKFEPINTTDTLILNVKNLQLNESSVHLASTDSSDLKIINIANDALLERVILTVERPFSTNTEYTLGLTYTGYINGDGLGLYYSNYEENGQVKYLAVTQLRPVHARRVFPCFDEPGFRATFKIEIIHDANHHAISNMPVLTQTGTGNKVKTTFQETPPIPPFLVAFMVSDFAGIKTDNFSGWAVPSKIEGIRWGTEVGPKLISAMENHIGLPYNVSKTDIVAQPLLIPVAMENWGLFNFREEFSLYFPEESKSQQKQHVLRFISHEVAHYWMGNSVSITWWDYLWLSEGFSMHYECQIPSLVFPSWKPDYQRWSDLHQAGLLEDSVPNSPLTTTVLTPAEISAKFSGLAYTKGPALLRMVINTLSEPQFVKGLKKFFMENYYSSATPDDFWSTLGEFGDFPTSLNEIMTNWTDISGYPEVLVIRNHTSADIIVSQSTFTINGPSRSGDKSWWIPISYTSKLQPNFEDTQPKFWIHGKEEYVLSDVSLSSDWHIFNVQATGFYRVNYDYDNWNNLIKQLVDDPLVIHELNRAQLIDDSFNLARSGRLNYSIPLSLARYLGKEQELTPWMTAFKVLKNIKEIMIYTSLNDYFLAYMRETLTPIYTIVGFEESEEKDFYRKMLRERIVNWACLSEVADCVLKSTTYVASLGPQSVAPIKVSPDVKETALCTGVAHGGLSAWETVKSLYLSSQPSSQQQYLEALACTNAEPLMYSFLFDSIGDLTEENWNKRLMAFASYSAHSFSLLRMLISERAVITNKFGQSYFFKCILEVTNGNLCTRDHLNMLIELESIGVQGLTEVISDCQNQVMWLTRALPDITRYFTNLNVE